MPSLVTRAGRYVKQATGYRAFIPASLPPEPPIEIGPAMLALLSRADQALGRLDGMAETLPNPDLFVAMYVRREAVLKRDALGQGGSPVRSEPERRRERGAQAAAAH